MTKAELAVLKEACVRGYPVDTSHILDLVDLVEMLIEQLEEVNKKHVCASTNQILAGLDGKD